MCGNNQFSDRLGCVFFTPLFFFLFFLGGGVFIEFNTLVNTIFFLLLTSIMF